MKRYETPLAKVGVLSLPYHPDDFVLFGTAAAVSSLLHEYSLTELAG